MATVLHSHVATLQTRLLLQPVLMLVMSLLLLMLMLLMLHKLRASFRGLVIAMR